MTGPTRQPAALAVLLHGKRIGVINRLSGDRYLFAFDEAYVEDANRPTLSLSYKGASGLVTTVKPTAMRLPAFFSNLLPEGALRDYLAAKAGVAPGREFILLWQLGVDLPGAVTVEPLDDRWMSESQIKKDNGTDNAPALLKFSLAGVQMKFSALVNGKGHLTIPTSGIGGSWIVKLPSPHYPAIAENEYAMMELARRIGIQVPEILLLPVDEIAGLPEDVNHVGGQALAVRRFDRRTDGGRVHMEDFAQVFGIYPDDKYKGRNYANIAAVLAAEAGGPAVHEFMRRLVFTVLTGNGDMHLKNWTLLYPDGRTPVLSPAYDLVATVPYLPKDNLALNFGGEKNIGYIMPDQVRRFAEKAGLPVNQLWTIAQETSAHIVDAWRDHPAKDLLPANVRDAIDAQIKRAAI
ncbi:MAG: type II toxin-antitoxin system HipA family toxin [Alphaproteobacteria bacterium]|nr:type II toxin-antitoxin system HipA family toxin [Alphaproteobacteria bacterium]